MPTSKLTTKEGIPELLAKWESAEGNSQELLWALSWRIGGLDPDHQRSKLRRHWVDTAQEVNRDTLQKAVNGCAAVVRLNGGRVPTKEVRKRIESHAPTVFGQKAARLNTDILTAKAVNLEDCLNPAKRRKASAPELVSADKVTVPNIGKLLGQLILNATDADVDQLVKNVVHIANSYVAEAKAKAK